MIRPRTDGAVRGRAGRRPSRSPFRAGLPMAGLALALFLAGPAAALELEATIGTGTDRVLTIRTTTDLAVLGPVIEAFAATEPGLAVQFQQWGSNDLLEVSRADCAAAGEDADLVLSSAVHHVVSLVNEGCARPWRSAATLALPPDLAWRDELFGVTQEPVVMVYNRDLVPEAEVPHSRFDLLDLLRPDESRYRGRVATYDIEESGLGFLLAFSDSLEATTYGSLLESFGRSGAVATCCSAEIIEGVIGGDYLLAYNVLGSYALEIAARERRLGIVAPSDYTLVLSRGAMIPRGAGNPEDAGALVDYLLSDAGRRLLAEHGLWTDLEPADGSVLESRGDSTVARPIPMSIALLVAMDVQTRAAFVALWRDTFGTD